MSILDDRREISTETIGQMKKDQKILANRQLMIKNLHKLIDSLEECEEYIQAVIEEKQAGSSEIGVLLNKCMGQFSSSDMVLLEEMVKTNFKDAMMTNNLSKLQLAQINLTERINAIFSQSLNKSILH